MKLEGRLHAGDLTQLLRTAAEVNLYGIVHLSGSAETKLTLIDGRIVQERWRRSDTIDGGREAMAAQLGELQDFTGTFRISPITEMPGVHVRRRYDVSVALRQVEPSETSGVDVDESTVEPHQPDSDPVFAEPVVSDPVFEEPVEAGEEELAEEEQAPSVDEEGGTRPTTADGRPVRASQVRAMLLNKPTRPGQGTTGRSSLQNGPDASSATGRDKDSRPEVDRRRPEVANAPPTDAPALEPESDGPEPTRREALRRLIKTLAS